MLAIGPLCIVSIVLVVAGAWKVVRPAVAAQALAALHIPGGPAAVRLLGVVEAIVGVAAVVMGGRVLAAAIAAFYAGFAIVAWRLRAAGAACGCFGALSAAPPTVMHVVVNVVSALVAIAATIVDVPGLVEAMDDLPGHGVPHVMLIAIGSVATLGLLTVLADAIAASAPQRTPQPVLFQPTRRAR